MLSLNMLNTFNLNSKSGYSKYMNKKYYLVFINIQRVQLSMCHTFIGWMVTNQTNNLHNLEMVNVIRKYESISIENPRYNTPGECTGKI